MTGQDDLVDDGNVAVLITVSAASSSDPVYDGLAPSANVTVSNNDDDDARIRMVSSGSSTSEAGPGLVTVRFSLGSMPTADVSVSFASSNEDEGTLSTNSVSWTQLTWNEVRTVTVTGGDDDVDDGDVAYTIDIDPAVSTDPKYSGRAPVGGLTLPLTNIDDETAAITVSALSPTSALAEGGAAGTFTVVLESEPLVDVVIDITSMFPTEAGVDKAALTFTDLDWSTPQVVTVTPGDDDVDDDDQSFVIHVAAASAVGDPKYDGLAPSSNVSVVTQDDDTAGIKLTRGASQTTEAGGTVTFTVELLSEPVDDVSIDMTSSAELTEGSLSTGTVSWTPMTWDEVRTVTVTGLDDDVVCGAGFSLWGGGDLGGG